ncbi:MAG TPA: ISKra4 family transposase [Ktedonobacteraceae bacterium]|nr:ISKra4 family transposase [Ktedonobacteraceae bacterium]
MAPAPAVGWAFFPLDEQLGLSSAGVTPRGEEILVRLSAWMPYEPARELLEEILGVRVSKASAWRMTVASGEAALAVEEAEVERLKQETPQAPAGADKQALSGDGAMVHLVGGEWAEVKTLALGEVTRTQRGEVRMQQLTYCSRLTDAASFEQATLLHTHRRGLERASAVCAVQDGAPWLQGLVDYHRVDAVRILDFAHAAEYIHEMGQLVQVAGGRLPTHWLEGVLHRLKHQGPARVLTHLAWLAARYPSALMQEKLSYLQKREAQMQYPTFQAAGWPIGSGSVESANKLVVEARLKGAGMRWRRQNVNPMLVLRNAVCNREWKQTWATSRTHRQVLRIQRRQAQSQQRLDEALWVLVIWGTRVHRLSHPSAAPTAPMAEAQAMQKQPTARPSSGYSWRKPFLRRPPSPTGPAERGCAKK